LGRAPGGPGWGPPDPPPGPDERDRKRPNEPHAGCQIALKKRCQLASL
jgi:hypothetical protein